jgi:hypothetical protein
MAFAHGSIPLPDVCYLGFDVAKCGGECPAFLAGQFVGNLQETVARVVSRTENGVQRDCSMQ